MRRLGLVLAILLAVLPGIASARGKTELTLNLPSEGARILVDGEQMVRRAAQQVTISVSHGKHKLRIELEGYNPVERNITLRSSSTSMDIKMEEDLPLAPTPPPAPKTFSSDLPMPPATPAVTPDPVTPNEVGNLRIAVMEVPAAAGLNAELATALTGAILEDTQKRPSVTAVGQQDLFFRLTSEQRGKVRACKDDACFTTLGFNLFVDELLISRVTPLSGSLLLTVERLDIAKGLVRGTTSRSVPADRQEQLLAQLVPSLDELYTDKPVTADVTRGPSLEAISQYQARPPLHRGVFIGTGVAALAAASVGGIFGALSNANMTGYNNATASPQPVSASGLENLRTQSVSQAQIANGAFIVAGVLALGAGIEAIFTDWSGRPTPPPTPETKPVALRIGAGGLQLTWR